ncbi:MAG TPA: TlpA disulfide reductase family protein [Fimbriimonadaceae bacterium]|jgi:thiol-disulfide isomerase/thioredoxin
MHSRFLISALAIVVAASSFAQGTKDPKQVLQDINAYGEQLQKQAAPMTRPQMEAAIKSKAKEELAGVDVTKIDPKDGFAWAQIYQMAGEDKTTCDLTHAYIKTNPTAKEKFDAQMLMMESCNNLGEGTMLDATLRDARATSPDDASNLSESAIYEFADTVAASEGPLKAAKLMEQMDRNLPAAPSTTKGNENLRDEDLHLGLKTEQAELLAYAGKKNDGLKILDKFGATLPTNSRLLRTFKSDRDRVALIGTAGPELKADKTIGDFTSLGDLKGKVVMLDYFAHWCPPCRASFPDESAMYGDLKDKGLQIVGVTQFYRYYFKENREKRDMKPDVEFSRMGDFVKQYNITWPVIFNDGVDSKEYGVGPIPQVVLIDKKGVVRDIEIGYVPANFSRFRAKVEELLKE